MLDHIAIAQEGFTPFAKLSVGPNPVDDVVSALVSSGKVRFGPAPSNENLEAIRKVVVSAISHLHPIPMLMPWGSKKPDNGTVDVAEVGGLDQLAALQARVQSVYEPGIQLVVRVEDTSGDYLFRDDGRTALEASNLYVREFLKLVNVIGGDFLDIRLESEMLDTQDYVRLADNLRPLFHEYIDDTDFNGIVDDPSLGSWQRLSKAGWQGFIPEEQRMFYRSRYARVGLGSIAQTDRMSGYFASILARIRMKGYGSEQWGKDFINLSFAPPVPGTPPAFAERRIYYRTLPETMTRTHIPPWRAHGYLRMEGEKVTMKLATFEEKLALEPRVSTICRNGRSVEVRADRLVVGG